MTEISALDDRDLNAGEWDISAQNDRDLFTEAFRSKDLNKRRGAEHSPPVKTSSPLAIPTLAVRTEICFKNI
jgi:hypothetical protein